MGFGGALRRLVGLETKSVLSVADAKASRIWGRLFGYGDVAAGKPVTPEAALQVSAFWACVKLLAETIATLPLAVYQREADGGRVAAVGHPLSTLLRVSPDGEHTAVEFWEGAVVSLCLHGDAFAEKIRSGGRLIALQALRADLMTVRRDKSGSLRYDYSDPRGFRTLGESEVWHLRAFGNAGLRGLSPLMYARQTISASIAADEASNKIFANGIRPSAVLQMDTILKPDQRKDIRENVVGPLAGSSNAGGVFVLEAGMKFTPISLSPADSQLLESRRWHVEEICRWFGIPPVLIGHASQGQTMWGTGVEQIVLSWLTLGLRSQLRRIEASVGLHLIEPAERARIYVEFAVEGLLRADSAGRAALYASLAQNGVMDRDEIREKENLNKRGGGAAKLTVQSNLLPIDDLAKVAVMPREKPVEDGAALAPAQAPGGGPTGRAPFDGKFAYAAIHGLKAFNPAQPRDEDGRFAGSGGHRKIRRMVRGMFGRKATERGHTSTHVLGPVGNHLHVERETNVRIAGFTRVLDTGSVRHALKVHGDSAREARRKPAQVAITRKDFERIPQIIAKADKVTSKGRAPGPGKPNTIQYEATLGRHRYTYVEEVRSGKAHVALKTLHKRLK